MARDSGHRRAGLIAATLVCVLAFAGCTAATQTAPLSPSPSASGALPASSGTVPSQLTDGPATALTTETPAPAATPTDAASALPSDAPTPSPTPTPPLPTGPLPSLDPTPAGQWTGLHWIALPGGHAPVVPERDEFDDPNFTLEAWSRGFDEFVWDPYKRVLTSYASADGMTWNAGPTMDTSIFAADLKTWDASVAGDLQADPGAAFVCTFEVAQFVEGAGTLILVGNVSCTVPGCGGVPFVTRAGMWLSGNGLDWTPASLEKAFGSEDVQISGGSNGFVALAQHQGQNSLLVSRDGHVWTAGTIPASLRASGSWSGQPIAFGGGYVIPGVVMEKKGHQEAGSGGGGCAGGPGSTDLSLYRATVWWSTDGTNWSEDKLPGTTSSYNGVTIYLEPIDSHNLLARGWMNGVDLQWLSNDGKTWVGLKSGDIPFAAFAYGSGRAIFETSPNDLNGPSELTSIYSVLGADHKLAVLEQTGDLPWPQDLAQKAFGPSGLLEVTADGTRFWLGVPTSN